MKNQEFYGQLIATLEQADQHMRKVISEAQELMERVVQVNPQMNSVSNGLMQQMVTDSMKFDVSEADG